MSRWLLALLAASLAFAQYEVPRKANEYPAHASWPRFDIGAEYMIHSVPSDKGALFARDYLIVEVAIYPAGEPVNILASHFTLRVNGKKSVLNAESPGFVAASIKYSDWEERPTLIGTAGTGNGSVVVGAPVPSPRFPGDPNGRGVNLPRTEREPDGRPHQENVDELVARAALPEGLARTPRKGVLFFAFDGKLKSVHKIELLYDDTHGSQGSLSVLPHATP